MLKPPTHEIPLIKVFIFGKKIVGAGRLTRAATSLQELMAANLYRRADRKCNPLSHHLAEALARQRPWLHCLRDLFSHIADTALLQYACVGESTWNAIIHYSPATEPLPAVHKYESSKNHWHILLRHNRIFNFLQCTLGGEQNFREKCDVPSSMVRAVMDSLSAPWNSLKYGRTLIS